MPLFSQSALFFFKPFRRDVRDIAILIGGEILVLVEYGSSIIICPLLKHRGEMPTLTHFM